MLIQPITRDQTLALGGIFQACLLVDDLARHGTIPGDRLEGCLSSLLNQNPESTEAVYRQDDSLQNLIPSFELIQELLASKGQQNTPNKAQNANVLRYVVSVLHLAKKLRQNPSLLDKVGEGLQKANQQADIFEVNHENVIANLAQLYQDTVGSLKHRIQVNGYANHLQQPAVASRIRCLLFSAIRSAVLWEQLGGRRYQLFFQRRKVLDQIHQIKRTL